MQKLTVAIGSDTSPSTRTLTVLRSTEAEEAGPITQYTDVSEVQADVRHSSAPRPFTHASGDESVVPKLTPVMVIAAAVSASTSRG